MGSIPVRVTIKDGHQSRCPSFILWCLVRGISPGAHIAFALSYNLSAFVLTHHLVVPCARMGSHLPLEDRQARLPGEERANPRRRRVSLYRKDAQRAALFLWLEYGLKSPVQVAERQLDYGA